MSETEVKAIEEMDNHELLQELVRTNRVKYRMINTICLLALIALIAAVVSMIILVPRLLNSLATINTSMENLNTLTEEVSKSLGDVGKIDFDTLNSAIEDFSKVVGALSKWFH